MAEKVFLNGSFIAADEAKVTAFDTGLLHGVGLFETLRSYRGQVFRLADHLERMRDSGRQLGIVFDADLARYETHIAELLKINGLSDARIRITVTAGSARVGIHTGGQAAPTTLITCGPHAAMDELYTHGVGVLLCDYRTSSSDPIARHKTICYLPRLLALRTAQRANLADALWFTDEGFLTGGSTGNVFLFKEDRLLTPSLDLPVLPGITRKAILEIARDLQIPVAEGRFTLQDVLKTPEIFLTGTTQEVLPVVAIEKHTVGNGAVGTVTRTILARYRRLARGE